MKETTYTYSQLSSQSVRGIVAAHYDLAKPVECKFYVLGLHDNYLIEVENRKYIFRIYRNDWRCQEEINFELDLLAFLGGKSSLVAFPLRTNAGELFVSIDSPEGKRAGALFHYADGIAPGNDITLEQSALLGNAVANIHRATETFSVTYTRPVLDIPYLLDASINAVAPFLDEESHKYLQKLQGKLHQRLPLLARNQELYGICIGDVNPTNFHINHKNQITLFDFDQCGYGYRAFDIGKYFSSIRSLKNKQEIEHAFLDGYQLVRQLSHEEIDAIPHYEIISIIWVMAIQVYNANRIGHKWLEKPVWDRRLAILKELDKDLSNQ